MIIGSVMAGKECPHHGWLTGLMVGSLSSLVLLMITGIYRDMTGPMGNFFDQNVDCDIYRCFWRNYWGQLSWQ